ncbi:bile acyl-CoA synthetase-like [Columba livia]|uniref:Bile acyl-CoA synthetase-like n=1 Tax=Columba livia TaxID=8932 RepID=A0A2I0LHB6_COLLI|nr:bile acyl-CoA synthetase-like [Columba livia]PKK16819.1 bile acyl-CoA synthetase-like [Columba livia]
MATKNRMGLGWASTMVPWPPRTEWDLVGPAQWSHGHQAQNGTRLPQTSVWWHVGPAQRSGGHQDVSLLPAGCEGRCGMAAVRLRPGRAFDGKQLYGVTSAALPAYAAPRFLRIQDSLEVTGTFKQRKTQLVRDGFDPGAIADPLFIRDDSAASYVPLTHDTFAAILDGKLNL